MNLVMGIIFEVDYVFWIQWFYTTNVVAPQLHGEEGNQLGGVKATNETSLKIWTSHPLVVIRLYALDSSL
jgi:hypothetical protein